MENIGNSQVIETSQCENTGSEQADYEEDASTADNSDTQLKADSPITNEKTDEEKIIHNTDNSFIGTINSPKTALLGKLKAKQRLQAFLLPKQNQFFNFPTRKVEADKIIKKAKQSPIDKAKSIIEELEEIKKVENAKLLSPPLFKERRPTYRDKHYRKKSRSRSIEVVKKTIEKGKYPESWQEIKDRKLSLEDVREIKLTRPSKNTKQQDNCYDFRKQLLFELPPQPLSSLKIKGVGSQDKTVPPQYIRFTKQLPSVSYSISHHKYKQGYLYTSEIYNYIPKSHLDIIIKCKTNSSTKFAETVPKKNVRKWYPKQVLSNITEGCELLEKSLGLSILQNYMDEEEDDEKNGINTYKDSFRHDENVDTDKTEIETQHGYQINLELKNKDSAGFSPMGNENDKLVKKEELNDMESEGEKFESEGSYKIKEIENKTYKHKKDKKSKKESRKRKHKKHKKEQEVKELKKKCSKSDKRNEKRNNDCWKEIKNKRKDNAKLDKKTEIDEKKKHNKENKEKEKEVIESDRTDNVGNELGDNIKRDRVEQKKYSKTDKGKDGKKANDWKRNKNIDKKENKKDKNKQLSLSSYYDELECIRARSLSKERIVGVDKEMQQKSRESSRESKRNVYKGDVKGVLKSNSDKEKSDPDIAEIKAVDLKTLKNNFEEEKNVKIDKIERQDNNQKESEESKEENLFKTAPLNLGEGLGTPDTEEYHSHWESDEDVRNVISYSPLPLKLNTSWESDDDMSSPDKMIHNRYPEQSSRNRDRSVERRSRKYFDGERSLEMPLNIVNLSRKDLRKSNKLLDFPDRKFLSSDTRLRYEEDSWERGEFLKMCNDIEGEKLRYERETLSEERRLLELEKRKLAEKLEKRTFNCDIFDNLQDSIVKEVTYEKIHTGNDDVYLKSTDYINHRKSKKTSNHEIKKKFEHKSKKRTHSVEDHKEQIANKPKQHNQNESKKFKHDKLVDIEVKYEKENFKYDTSDNVSDDIQKHKMFLSSSKNTYEPSDLLSTNEESRSSKYKHDKLKDAESTCDSLISDIKETSKSDILENEYEEFLKAVTGDISKSESTSKERKSDQKTGEIKKTKSTRKRKYSTSSSSSSNTSSSSDSDDSDSSSSSSTSSSYTSTSTSSSEREKKRRKVKAKHKEKGKGNAVKIEMTHSIVKNLDDLQAFPISKPPIVQIKQEQEDPGYSEIPTINTVIKDVDYTVPLPVPSPAIVPPPYLNLLPVKQEKSDSVSSKADSTTSPAKKVPLIPTKFIAPLSRKEISLFDAPHSSTILDFPKKDDTILIKPYAKDIINPTATSSSSPFSFSIANKHIAFCEEMNDSDSQELKDSFSSKKIIVDDANIYEKELSVIVELSKSVDVRKETFVATENKISMIIESLSPSHKPTTLNKSSKEESVEKASPGSLLSFSPKQVGDPSEKHFGLKDIGKTSDVKPLERSSRKSISPKHRNVSPRRSDLPRKLKDSSPSYRKSSRHSDESSSRKHSPRRRRSPERQDRHKSSPSYRSKKNQSSRSHMSVSPRRRRSPSPRNRRSPSPRNRRSPSPRNRRSPSPRNRRSPSPRMRRLTSPGHRRSPSPRIRRSSSPRQRRSLSPRIRRSHSPSMNRSISPRSRKSPFRSRSPNYRSSPPRKTYRRSYSRSPSPVRKKESIQKTLQRLAGIEDHYQQPVNKSPINSPVDGFKRSVADSTISDDQLLQQNSTESLDSPAYRTSIRLVRSPASPKRLPLDIRISQVLGLDKENPPNPITTVYTQTNYVQSYTYDQYSEQYGHYPQYNQDVLHKDNYIHQQPPNLPKSQSHGGSSKVVQIGNMLQVVPTEEAPPQDHKPPTQKIVQVGNMLQIVPTPAPHITKEAPIPTQVSVSGIVQRDTSLGVLQSSLSLSQPPPPPPTSVDNIPNTTPTHEKLSPEELMLQKIAERRAERAKRHEEREKRRKEKEKRRKEKERKKQLRLKMKTENMIKKALRIETEALAMGENMDDEENEMDTTPSCWPSVSVVSSSPLKAAGKGILITHGFSKLNIDEDSEQKKCKCVKFADGVAPGEGTSPSGGEELSSPPPPKEKRFKKIKKKKIHKKKKIKVKIIRKSSADSPDDEELDNLPPPSPPPGSPPPHVFPARIKTHTNNNILPSYATGVPLMPVGNYAPQFRPSIPVTVPPPIHNLPHHGPSTPRPPPQIMSPHGPPVHGSMPHGLSPGVPHGIPNHAHGSMHHPSGPRV